MKSLSFRILKTLSHYFLTPGVADKKPRANQILVSLYISTLCEFLRSSLMLGVWKFHRDVSRYEMTHSTHPTFEHFLAEPMFLFSSDRFFF